MRICENGLYRDATPEEEAAYIAANTPTVQERVEEYKRMLAESDYKAIKFAEGVLPESEYAPIREMRQSWRDEINRLEGSE